jgi:hypothetical protein
MAVVELKLLVLHANIVKRDVSKYYRKPAYDETVRNKIYSLAGRYRVIPVTGVWCIGTSDSGGCTSFLIKKVLCSGSLNRAGIAQSV